MSYDISVIHQKGILEVNIMKMIYETRACGLSVAKHFHFRFDVPCDYEEATVRYAVCRFFTKTHVLQKKCTYESWQKRLLSGKKRRKKMHFSFVVPASAMELPGMQAQITGTIDAIGVTIHYLEVS